jgi:hypothetical protein
VRYAIAERIAPGLLETLLDDADAEVRRIARARLAADKNSKEHRKICDR